MHGRILSVAGLIIAGAILGLSLWKSADDQAYARVVPESVQEAMEMEALKGPSNRVWGIGSLPWEAKYYLSVAGQRVRLLAVRDPIEQVKLRVGFARERVELASDILGEGDTSLAVKTANKGVHYLEYAMNLWRDTEMDGADRAELGRLIHVASREQELSIHTFKEEVVDLADSAVDGLCERLTMIQEATKDYVLDEAS